VTELHRSGFIALAGRPNVGKSTLVNALLKESILPVSPKPQTTRKRQLGILTTQQAQAVFVDTPGIHAPHHRLGELMNETAQEALLDADLVLCVFDLHVPPGRDDQRVASAVETSEKPSLAALNKIDLTSPADLQSNWEAYERLLPFAKAIGVSATRGDNLELLLAQVFESLPPGPRYYPEAEVTDAYERDLAADLIRSAALELLRQEVPHSVAVVIDEYRERNERVAFIAATLYVERDSQKGIVIGKGGQMLREIGKLARRGIEAMSGRRVYLRLQVKVLPGWRNDEQALQRLGYGTRSASRLAGPTVRRLDRAARRLDRARRGLSSPRSRRGGR